MYLGKIGPTKSPYKIIFVFCALTFFVIAFVFYTSFSRAKIILKPRMEKISTEFNINIGKEKLGATMINGRFFQKEFDGSEELNNIPKKTVEDFAKGKVTVFNKQEKGLTLVINSQLKPANSNIIFKTDQALILPAGAKVQVGITAAEKGTKGNLEPTKFTFVKLWPGWANIVYAESKDKLFGGEKTGKIISEEEISDLKNKLEEKLFNQGIKELNSDIGENEDLWDKMVKREVKDFRTSKNAGEEADKLRADMKLKLTGIFLNKEMLDNLALAKLKEKIIDGKEFTGIDENSFRVDILEMDYEKKKAEFRIFLEGNIHAKLDGDEIDKEKIIGLNKEELNKYYLKYNKEIENIEVYFSPFWQRSVPSSKDHIEITISN